MKSVRARGNGVNHRWISIVGTRPQFVKLAPVCRAIHAHNVMSGAPQIEHCIIHTGQHYDREVAELFFDQMQIPQPRQNLAVGSGAHGSQLARMLVRLEQALVKDHPDWILIYGDTNSSLAGTLIAARLKLPIAHVEAGCRSANMEMPEEQCRIVADHLSKLLLAPSQLAVENLHREGIGAKNDPLGRRTVMVGDLMYDALLQNLPFAEKHEEESLQRYELEKRNYYLLTIHRAENTNEPEQLSRILETAGALDRPVLFPVHPRTRQILAGTGISLDGQLRPVASVGYLEMLALEKYARMILTDSGGVQKEAFYLGVPCITLREQTEWPETVELGANRVCGGSPELIRNAIRENHANTWPSAQPYGDGRAAEAIVKELLSAAVRRGSSAKTDAGELQHRSAHA